MPTNDEIESTESTMHLTLAVVNKDEGYTSVWFTGLAGYLFDVESGEEIPVTGRVRFVVPFRDTIVMEECLRMIHHSVNHAPDAVDRFVKP